MCFAPFCDEDGTGSIFGVRRRQQPWLVLYVAVRQPCAEPMDCVVRNGLLYVFGERAQVHGREDTGIGDCTKERVRHRAAVVCCNLRNPYGASSGFRVRHPSRLAAVAEKL